MRGKKKEMTKNKILVKIIIYEMGRRNISVLPSIKVIYKTQSSSGDPKGQKLHHLYLGVLSIH